MKITITKEQLLEVGASSDCTVYQKFIAEHGGELAIKWTLEKQLEALCDPIYRQALGWLWWKGILESISMAGIDLSGADLICADLVKANLSGANLCGANLCLANLRGADLIKADLIKADLIKADLSGANLSEANLHEADLHEADLSRAIYNAATIWPDGVPPVPVGTGRTLAKN